jgi:hypothetical protein
MIRFVSFPQRLRFAVLPCLAAMLCACSEDTSVSEAASPSPTTQQPPAAAAATSPATDQFFTSLRPASIVPATRPEPKGDLTFTLDILEAKDKAVRIRGWGFRLSPAHQKGDTVTVLLAGPGGAYSAATNVESRPDVSAVLKQPGLDDSGFVGIIDTSTVQPGEYTVFLRIGGADGEAIKSTNRTLKL